MTNKYADKVTSEHAEAMQAIGIAAQILTAHTETFEAFLKAERSMHTTLLFTDPTTYKDALNSKNFALTTKMIQAATAFVLAIQDVKAEALK